MTEAESLRQVLVSLRRDYGGECPTCHLHAHDLSTLLDREDLIRRALETVLKLWGEPPAAGP